MAVLKISAFYNIFVKFVFACFILVGLYGCKKRKSFYRHRLDQVTLDAVCCTLLQGSSGESDNHGKKQKSLFFTEFI